MFLPDRNLAKINLSPSAHITMISSVVEHENDAQTLLDTEYICLATSPCHFKAEFQFGKK